jgi:hypothetical protein
MRIVSVLAATGVGAVVGWICGLVPMWPIARLATAAVMGAVVGAAGVVLLVFFTLSRSGSGGLGAVSFGVSEAALLGVPAVILLVMAGYFALRWMGLMSTSVVTYAPIPLGGGAALLAALWVASGIAVAGDGVGPP